MMGRDPLDAFADGRRLRNDARRYARARARHAAHRARMEAHRAAHEARQDAHRARRHIRRMHRSARRHSPVRTGIHFLLVLVVVAMAMGTTAVVALASVVGLLAFAAVPALVIGLVVIAVAQAVRKRPAIAPGTARPAAPRPDTAWKKARERFTALRAEYAAFECDPMRVLRRPALTDVSVASTARFIDAFAEAQALETDTYPPEDHGAKFVAAVDHAERAWKAACDAADRIRLSGLSDAERSTVERVIKLLTTARDSDSEAERIVAYGKARSELLRLDTVGVVHLPRTAAAALERAARGILPP